MLIEVLVSHLAPTALCANGDFLMMILPSKNLMQCVLTSSVATTRVLWETQRSSNAILLLV
jgi:hypothetical protein